MSDFSIQELLLYLLLFGGFVLPGAISIYVYGLIRPVAESRLKDKIAEAVCFGFVNFVILFPVISYLFDLAFVQDHPAKAWMIYVASFILAPVIWPIGLIRLLLFAERRRWVAALSNTAWDEFFHPGPACWIKIQLKDGSVVGGRFSSKSYASAYPRPGHIYIEELWHINTDGSFSEPELGGPGILLRPEDYSCVRVYTAGQEVNNA